MIAMTPRGLVLVASLLLVSGCATTGAEPSPTSSASQSSTSASPMKTATPQQWASIIAAVKGPMAATQGLLTGCEGNLCKTGIIAVEANAGLLAKKISEMVATYGQPPEEIGSLVGETNGLAQAAQETAANAKAFCPGSQCARYASDTLTSLTVLMSSFDAWAPYL